MMKPTNEELKCLIHNTTHDRLLCLNDVKARLYLPVTVFLALLIIVGTIGNTAVCLVYWRRKSRVSSHYFILSLAVLDLFTCVIGMPTEIADLVLPYTFEYPWACKILRFTHSSTIIASSTILIQVAFDRYYRICQLGRQFSANKARLLCFGAVLLGFICSWPTFLLFGRKTVTRRLKGQILKGTDCSTDDSMRKTMYPTIYYVFLFSLFGLTVMFFGVLYTKIGLTILRRKKFTSGSLNSPPTPEKNEQARGEPKVNMAEPPSSDLSSEQDDSHGPSTASSCSNASNNSNHSNQSDLSTSTSTTTISSLLYGSLRRYWKRRKMLDSVDSWMYPASPKPTLNTEDSSCKIDEDNADESNNDNSVVATSPSTCNTETSFPTRTTKTASNPTYLLIPSDIMNTEKATTKRHTRVLPERTTAAASATIYSIKAKVDSDNNTGSSANRYSTNYNPLNLNTIPDNSTVVGTIESWGCKTETRQQRRCRYYTRHPPLQQQQQQHHHHSTDHIFQVDKTQLPKFVAQKEKATSQRSSQRQLRVGKTTTVLFAVTLAYILSFLPYLTVMVMRSIIKDLEENLSPVGELAYKLCVKSFFINNAINPLIYSFLNQAFRQDAKQMFQRMCGCSRNSSLPSP